MHYKVLDYALEYAKTGTEGDDVAFYKSDGSLYIQTKSGRCFELSENEVLCQAEQYLDWMKSSLRHL